jgi:hypothetical protein
MNPSREHQCLQYKTQQPNTHSVDSVHARFLELIDVGRVDARLLELVDQPRPLLLEKRDEAIVRACGGRARAASTTYEFVRFLRGRLLARVLLVVLSALHGAVSTGRPLALWETRGSMDFLAPGR